MNLRANLKYFFLCDFLKIGLGRDIHPPTSGAALFPHPTSSPIPVAMAIFPINFILYWFGVQCGD